VKKKQARWHKWNEDGGDWYIGSQGERSKFGGFVYWVVRPHGYLAVAWCSSPSKEFTRRYKTQLGAIRGVEKFLGIEGSWESK